MTKPSKAIAHKRHHLFDMRACYDQAVASKALGADQLVRTFERAFPCRVYCPLSVPCKAMTFTAHCGTKAEHQGEHGLSVDIYCAGGVIQEVHRRVRRAQREEQEESPQVSAEVISVLQSQQSPRRGGGHTQGRWNYRLCCWCGKGCPRSVCHRLSYRVDFLHGTADGSAVVHCRGGW